MNLKSKIYIGIIAFSLAVIVAVLSARRIQSVWFKPDTEMQGEIAEDGAGYYPFVEESEKEQSSESEQMPNRMVIATEAQEAYVPEKQMQKPFFGGQIDLPALAKEQEEYIRGEASGMADINQKEFKNNAGPEVKFDKYEQDPIVKQFMIDMQKAMGPEMLNGQLSPQEMMEKMLNNPQMQKILLEYSKNPKIMQIAEDMMKQSQAAQKQMLQQSGKVNKN